jgi:eukaryotic-like serine/threonine-protein kinase
MTTPETPPTQGLIAGKYQLVRMIGRGGMGSVWEGKHVSLGTSCAIKFIEAEYADSHEARSRFDREAKSAATIQSKHAIQIYDHGVTDDGKPFIVMEMLQGEPLDKRIERFGRLTLQATARIIQQVSRALTRAHERGIVHRDLKPENIFLVRTPDDDDEIAKVLDFGIAKVSAEAGAVTSSTKTGAVLGTPFYMSPEQARGLRNVDHRTDLWSLGVIAYKCVTGRLPFEGESVGDLLVKICTAPLAVPTHIAPDLPPNFDAWFFRALERDPERRFSSATELADTLCFVAGLPTRSGQASTPFAAAYPDANARPPYGPVPTPAPRGMTNAPYTISTNGITTGGTRKWAWVALPFVALLGAGATYYAIKGPFAKRPPEPVVATTALHDAPSSAPIQKDAPEVPHDDTTALSAPSLDQTPAPSTSSPKHQAKPGTKVPPAKPTATTPPPPPFTVPVTPLPAATTPPPAPTTTAKKPNRYDPDPGY